MEELLDNRSELFRSMIRLYNSHPEIFKRGDIDRLERAKFLNKKYARQNSSLMPIKS